MMVHHEYGYNQDYINGTKELTMEAKRPVLFQYEQVPKSQSMGR